MPEADARPAGPHSEIDAPRDEGGFVMVWFALTLVVLIAMAGFGVDVWRWWHTSNQVQKAADAGALAGVVFLPSDVANAQGTALDLVEANGFLRTEGSASPTSNANQLRVRHVALRREHHHHHP
jgi:Flp pilus assembly protein TadG